MVNLIRKYQQTLMIAITVLVIVAFIGLYNSTRFDRIAADQAFKIYGKTFSQTDIQRAARRYSLARALGMNEMVYGLGGSNSASPDEGLENFVFNGFVLDHEGKAFGISPTDAQVTEALKGLQPFQTNGSFDPSKYQEFVMTVLGQNGFTSAQLEDLVRDELRFKKLVDIIGSTVEVTPGEFRDAYIQAHQKTDTSLVRLKLTDFTAAVKPSDDQIKKYYDDHKSSYTTDEERVVSYVQLALTDAEKQLKGKEKVDALQKLSDRANAFTQAMLEKDANFNDVAKKLGLQIKTTPAFTEAQPASDLSVNQQVAAECFRLSEKDPNSDAIPADAGFFVLHLDKVVPARPLTAEEARPKVIEQIKAERGHDALVSKGNETRAKITADLKAGKSFADAAKDAGLTVENFPSFSASQPVSDKPNASEIADKAQDLADGDVSDFVATEDGGIIIHLDKREPIDEAAYTKEKDAQIGGMRTQKRYAAFRQWLQARRKEADVQNLDPRAGKQAS